MESIGKELYCWGAYYRLRKKIIQNNYVAPMDSREKFFRDMASLIYEYIIFFLNSSS